MNRCSLTVVCNRAMPLAVSLCATAIAAGLAGCSAGGPITYASSYGPGMKLSGLGSTYAWAPEGSEERAGTEELHELVHDSVDKHLAEQGFALKPSSPVDFWVTYRLARRQQADSTVLASGEIVEAGSLVLKVLDPASRELIWRGIARARIQESDPPDVRKQRLEAAVRGLMQRFPKKA